MVLNKKARDPDHLTKWMLAMIFRQLFDHNSWTYTYILGDEQSGEAIVIDPVIERLERDLQLLEELGLRLKYTLDTHIHADHVTASGTLRARTGAQSVASHAAQVGCVDIAAKHGDRLAFGPHEVEVRSTPGHTNGCLTFVVEHGDQTLAFTGDAIFVRGCGRTDFQQGDPVVLFDSVHSQIFSLPPDTLIYPAHDYRGHAVTTVREERRFNPRLHDGVSREAFVEIMNTLVLANPKLMDVAVVANMSCGIVPGDPKPSGARPRAKQGVAAAATTEDTPV